MEIPNQLLCLFSADISDEGDRYVIEVPRREIETGGVSVDGTYRIALIDTQRDDKSGESGGAKTPEGEPQPPVEPGEIRYVEIEDLGKQGDGIARVERGYVIIVPGTKVGERVKIEISEVKSNFAVGEKIEDQ